MASTDGLSHNVVDLEVNDDSHPRRFFTLGDKIYIYGGDTAEIVRLPDPSQSSPETLKVIRRWDEDSVRAIAISPNQRFVAVGMECGTTQIYKFDVSLPLQQCHPFVSEAEEEAGDSLLSQSDFALSSPRLGEIMTPGPSFDTPIRDAVFLDDRFLALASESDSFVVDVNKLDSHYLKSELRQAHEGVGCRALTLFKPSDKSDGRYLATLGLDGRMSYWDCGSETPTEWKQINREVAPCVSKKDEGEILGADAWDRSCQPTAHKGWIALPGATYWQWRKTSKSTIDYHAHDAVANSHTKAIVKCVPCPNKHWITIGRDGRVLLWKNAGTSIPVMELVEELATNLEPAPTDVLFFHQKNLLYVSTADGKVLVWNFNKLHSLQRNSSPASAAATDDRNSSATSATVPTERVSSDVNKATSTLTTKGTSSIGKRRLQKMGEKKDAAAGIREDSDEDDDDIDFTNTSKQAPRGSPSMVDDEAEVNDNCPGQAGDDLGDVQGDQTPLNGITDFEDADDDDDLGVGGSMFGVAPAPITMRLPEAQAAFAPSATPLDLPRRYLCWNHIGIATLISGEKVDRPIVNIHFHNSGFRMRPSINFTDNLGLIMGSVGEDGGIFASDLPDGADEDPELGQVVDGLQISERTKAALKKTRNRDSQTPGSTIYFHRFETFASLRDKDWFLTLPNGERALGCACGEGWSAVVTSRRFLRFFTTGGNQELILWLPGEPVTTVGRSRFLAVFYHEAMPLMDGTQKLGYCLYDSIGKRKLGGGSVSCISPGASLSWVGFSTEGSLMAMDSDGMLSMLMSMDQGSGGSPSWNWMPVLDTLGLRKSSEDTFWPVSVSEGKLNCVPLKGGTKYPDVARRPLTTQLGFRLPLSRQSTLKDTILMEELSVRAEVALQQKRIMHELLDAYDEVDEEFESEYRILSTQVDKVTLKMFAKTIEAGKQEKAFDLVHRLHLEKSFDIAMTIAERFHKLVDRIEQAKLKKFGEVYEQSEESFESPVNGGWDGDSDGHSHITPDTSSAYRNGKRAYVGNDQDRQRMVRRRD